MRWIFLIAVLGCIYALGANELNGANGSKSFWETYTAALRGDKIAQFQVGVIYERGIGMEENQTLAAHWFEKSAQQGYVDAQYNIAIMYASGRGVAADEGLAMMWLARAAKQKDVEARKLLLNIVDGKLDGNKENNSHVVKEGVSKGGETIGGNSNEATIIDIAPITLIAKVAAVICDEKNQCTPYKSGTALTSTKKRGGFYKISGIVTKRGWQPYDKEGWIDETSVEVRR